MVNTTPSIKIQTHRNVQMLCHPMIMCTCHIPSMQTYTSSLSHKGQLEAFHTSTPPQSPGGWGGGGAAPSISMNPLVWEHLETFEDVRRIKGLLIWDRTSQKSVKWGLKGLPWKSRCPHIHCFTCGCVKGEPGKAMQSAETIVGLCHLLAKLGGCCPSGQLARLVALDLSDRLRLSTEEEKGRDK